jgi:hypothetical protein
MEKELAALTGSSLLSKKNRTTEAAGKQGRRNS